MAAFSVVILLLGAVLGLGIYASPMIAGICLLPIGRTCGTKYHVILWIAVSILSFIFVPDVEENLMYLCLFGLYPILYPRFQKIPKGLRIVAKLLFFNVVFIAVEVLVMLFLVPEAMGTVLMVVFLLLGNLMFLCYDFIIPRAEMLLGKYLKKILKI